MAEIVNRLVPVELCSPHPQNYNVHDESQIADLRVSLRRFGQVRSIVVQDDGGGGFLLVAGHGVHKAAKAEGMAELRADVLPADWTPARVLAYLAADNELARRGMPDEAQLAAIVRQVEAEADAELAKLAAGGEQALAQILAQLQGQEGADGAASGTGTLAERFLVPPFSVLDARQGYWQERKRAWLALGIQSELGRGKNLRGLSSANDEYRYNKNEYLARIGRGPNASPGGAPRDAASLGPDGHTVRGDGHGRPMVPERERE